MASFADVERVELDLAGRVRAIPSLLKPDTPIGFADIVEQRLPAERQLDRVGEFVVHEPRPPIITTTEERP